ncbi:uncharacterized protein LOC117162861 isoform X2 [Bombus vancouverensis nearcticus]|uniref:uncharacterized protein LOC117162861 isoform X2 n=1 Tax=Bombus vancouverensis nearcticus TaxID=2705178 RepID=UPI00402B6B54
MVVVAVYVSPISEWTAFEEFLDGGYLGMLGPKGASGIIALFTPSSAKCQLLLQVGGAGKF